MKKRLAELAEFEIKDTHTVIGGGGTTTCTPPTTDKKVNQITPALFEVADTPAKMAALDPDRILAIIREVGLAPTKARNLWTAANQIHFLLTRDAGCRTGERSPPDPERIRSGSH